MADLAYTETGGFAVVAIPPTLDQNDWLAFREKVHRQFVDRGTLRIIFDCEQCPDLPSIAFGVLTSLSRDLRRMSGSLDLVHVSEKVRTVMHRTRISELVPVRGNIAEILARNR